LRWTVDDLCEPAKAAERSRASAMRFGAGSSPNTEAGRLGLKLGNTQGATMRSIIIGLIGLLPFVASPVLAADAATQEANKKTVLEFYEAGLNKKDFDAAAKFFGPHYIQHNPTAPDGIEGFKAFLGFLREKFPDSRSEIKRAFADGDYVILHVHSVREKGARGRAIVDIFRLENGKIVEHWDVAQEIPEKAANTNGMF
jgi:predicted SnoaL-like aldol condensation-catalyzing enzyme